MSLSVCTCLLHARRGATCDRRSQTNRRSGARLCCAPLPRCGLPAEANPPNVVARGDRYPASAGYERRVRLEVRSRKLDEAVPDRQIGRDSDQAEQQDERPGDSRKPESVLRRTLKRPSRMRSHLPSFGCRRSSSLSFERYGCSQKSVLARPSFLLPVVIEAAARLVDKTHVRAITRATWRRRTFPNRRDCAEESRRARSASHPHRARARDPDR